MKLQLQSNLTLAAQDCDGNLEPKPAPDMKRNLLWRLAGTAVLAAAALLTLSPRARAQVTIQSLGAGATLDGESEFLVGGDLTDPENDGDTFAGEDDPSWNWVSISTDSQFGFGGGAFDVFDNKLGSQASWCCSVPRPDSPLHVTVEFDPPVALKSFTVSSGVFAQGDPTVWAIQGSNLGSSAFDADGFEDIYRRDDATPVWNEPLEVVRFTLPQSGNTYRFIRYIAFESEPPWHQLGEIEYFQASADSDSDSDGMEDSYETGNGLNPLSAADRDTDLDGDTLANFAEFQAGTKPNDRDTDDDGLDDNVESGSGTWANATNTGTSPLLADTDKDGLRDGVETNTGVYVSATNTGTNPHDRDSDNDGAPDGAETGHGTSPLDPLAFLSPLVGNGEWELTHIWTNGSPGLASAAVVEAVLANPGASPRIAAKSRWINFNDDSPPPWFKDEAVPFPLWTAEGLGDRNHFLVEAKGDINVKTAGTVTFVCNSDDGFQLFIDGVLAGEAGGRPRSDTIMPVALAAGVHSVRFLYWESVGGAGVTLANYRRLGDAPLPDGNDWELTRPFAGAPGVGGPPFQITSVARTAAGITLRWPSSDGQQFSVEFSSTLADAGWLQLADGLGGDGDEASYLDTDAGRRALKSGYYRVRRK